MGINNINKSFYISFCFNLNESEESYKWALDQNKELYALLSLSAHIIIGLSALKAIP